MIVAALVPGISEDAWWLVTDAVPLAIFETLYHLNSMCAFLETLEEYAIIILHAFGIFFKNLISHFYI